MALADSPVPFAPDQSGKWISTIALIHPALPLLKDNDNDGRPWVFAV
jgi:hypothetical protein